MDTIEAEKRAHKRIDRMSVVGFPQQEEFAALHEQYRFFRVYMLARTAAAGSGPRLTHALTALFPYGLVENALRRVAESDDLATVRDACIEATATAGDRLYGEAPDADELADRLEAIVDAADFADRPLAAAWADLPRPDGVGARIERAATVLREHRGNGHISVLTAHGLTGADALLLTGVWKEYDDVEASAKFFGWREEGLSASWDRLVSTGRVDAEHTITDAGRQEREAIEELTEALAAARWETIAPDDRARTVELLEASPTAR